MVSFHSKTVAIPALIIPNLNTNKKSETKTKTHNNNDTTVTISARVVRPSA
jgi:hypothetical protein